jgi:hypothetical protein
MSYKIHPLLDLDLSCEILQSCARRAMIINHQLGILLAGREGEEAARRRSHLQSDFSLSTASVQEISSTLLFLERLRPVLARGTDAFSLFYLFHCVCDRFRSLERKSEKSCRTRRQSQSTQDVLVDSEDTAEDAARQPSDVLQENASRNHGDLSLESTTTTIMGKTPHQLSRR